jgi:hypothetical protein
MPPHWLWAAMCQSRLNALQQKARLRDHLGFSMTNEAAGPSTPVMGRPLLWRALDGEGAEFRVFVADLS